MLVYNPVTGELEESSEIDSSNYDFGYGTETPAPSLTDDEIDSYLDSFREEYRDENPNMTGFEEGTIFNILKQGGQRLLDLFKGPGGKTDWSRLLTLAGGAYAASRPNTQAPTGYQGKIPKYTAERQMLTAPPVGRRPGSGGIDYGGGVTFKNPEGEVVQSNARSLADLRTAASSNPFNRPADYEAPKQSGGVASPASVSNADIQNWFATNQGADDNTIAAAMQQYRVNPQQLANAMGFDPEMVTSRYNATQGLATPVDAVMAPVTSNFPGGIDGLSQILGVSSPGAPREYDAPERFMTPSEDAGEDYAKGGIAGGLAPKGFVLPADVVSHAGNGSSEAGLKLLAAKYGAEPIKGAGDGMSDSIPTTIGGKQEARVANDEAFISPDEVKRIGGGDAEKGAKKLYAMMDSIREERTGTKKQGKQIDPEKFMPGGSVDKYVDGGTTTTTTAKSTLPKSATGSESSLSNWAGDYVTDLMGRGSALAQTPYQAYTGPLTAGASGLQQQAFNMASGAAPSGLTSALSGLADYQPTGGGGASASNVSSTYVAPGAYKPGEFSTGIFGTEQAQQYMNPYLQSALEPKLAEARRQADISRIGDAGRLTKAGAFGGSRQAIMESEGRRNLMDKQNEMLTSGYSTAYDKAMQQFNADQLRELDVQKAREQAGQFGYGQTADQAKTAADLALRASTANQSAALTASQINSAAASAADTNRLQALLGQGNLGLSQLNQLTTLGGIERGIESEGIAADKTQFEEARLNPFNMIQFEQSLLSGMPLTAQSYNMPSQSDLQQFASGAITAEQFLAILSGKAPAVKK
jgi:hypothetical protein